MISFHPIIVCATCDLTCWRVPRSRELKKIHNAVYSRSWTTTLMACLCALITPRNIKRVSCLRAIFNATRSDRLYDVYSECLLLWCKCVHRTTFPYSTLISVVLHMICENHCRQFTCGDTTNWSNAAAFAKHVVCVCGLKVGAPQTDDEKPRKAANWFSAHRSRNIYIVCVYCYNMHIRKNDRWDWEISLIIVFIEWICDCVEWIIKGLRFKNWSRQNESSV